MPRVNSRRPDSFSVLIAGAGPVGLTVAALLAAAGEIPRLRLEILESGAAKAWDPARTDLRVYALSRASQRLFECLGVWETMLGRRAAAYRRMHIWQGDDPESAPALHFDCAEIGEPDLGHIVEDVLIRDVLAAQLTATGKARISYNAVIDTVNTDARGVEVALENGRELRGDLLIAADGGASTVRELLGIPTWRRNYGQTALVAHVESERPHGAVARQRFLPGGPLALLPLHDGRSSVVWSLPAEQAARYCELDDEAFIARLQDASGGALGRLGPVSERAGFPLRMLHAVNYCVPRIVLAGDAAHCVHPLAGQGMNLGLLDAAVLADELIEAVRKTGSAAGMRPLRRYERRRKGDNLRMMLAFDAIDRCFRLPAVCAPLSAFGLRAADATPVAKRLFMRQALGLGQRLPAAFAERAA